MKVKHFLFLLVAFNITMLISSPVKAGDGDDHKFEKRGDDHNNNNNDDHHYNNNDQNYNNDHHDKDKDNNSWWFPFFNPGGDKRAPIDGGIGILLVAGVGYGIKRVSNKKKKPVEK